MGTLGAAHGASSRWLAPSWAPCGAPGRAGRRALDDETEHLASVIKRIPGETGALVILVDHDMSLVSACCATAAVLDFGRLIASGTTAEVLRNEHVMRAYLGTETEL